MPQRPPDDRETREELLRGRLLLRIVDGSSLTALTLLVAVGFLLVYAIV